MATVFHAWMSSRFRDIEQPQDKETSKNKSRLHFFRDNLTCIWPEIPWDLNLWRRPACRTLLKALDTSSATAQLAPDLLKDLATLSDATVRISAVHWEDLKLYWKSEKRPYFSRWSTILIFKFIKDLTNYRKKTNRVVVFSSRPFSNILKYRDHQYDLPTIWKTWLFQTHVEEFS